MQQKVFYYLLKGVSMIYFGWQGEANWLSSELG